MKKLSVLYITDEKYAPLVGVSVTSLFKNNPVSRISLTVYILTTNMSTHNKTLFENLAKDYEQQICTINVGKELEKIEKLNISKYRGSSITNLRLCFDKFIPRQVQRLLYLDADTIVCGNIEELADFDMHGKMLGMVHDAYGKIIVDKDYKGDAYYNAGVILFDCEKWRKEMWREQILRYINDNGAQFTHPDQDLYNFLCKSEIICLPIRYNLQPVHSMYPDKVVYSNLGRLLYYSKEEIAEGRNNPAVLHMIRVFGRNPWHKKNSHPFNDEYRRYKELSLWSRYPDEKKRIGLAFLIEILLSKLLPDSVFFPISLMAMRIYIKLQYRMETYEKSK